jgi:secreted trypsin-like serine protease
MNGTMISASRRTACTCGGLCARETEEEYELEGEYEYEYEEEFEGEHELQRGLERELEGEYEEEYQQESEEEYEIRGRDDRILNRDTSLAPFRYICNLEISGRSICTGTLISPRHVLTAGHCLMATGACNSTGPVRPNIGASMRVLAGRNGPRRFLAQSRVAGCVVFPAYRACTATDLAILRLRDPIGLRIGYWSRVPRSDARRDPRGTSMLGFGPRLNPAGVPVNTAGYPADLPKTPALGCRLGTGVQCRISSGPGRNAACGTFQFRAFDQRVAITSSNMLRYFNDTCGGQSGSPVWVKRDRTMGGRVLVGVHVSPSGQRNQAVLLTPSRMRWVAQNVR